MRITLLGSGQDGALPQAGAGHRNDDDARSGTIPERTGPSLLVEHDGSRLLCDVSPDFRLQWWARGGLPDTVAITHAHMGHYAGLVHLGKEAAAGEGIVLHATPRMRAFLAGNAPWSDLLADGRLVAAGTTRWAGIDIELVPVPHRGPHTDTVAVSIGGRVLWLPDIDSWDAWPGAEEVVSRHELAFLDGTFWSPGEIPGRATTDIPHPLVPDTVARFGRLATRVVLVHLNHTNPLCEPTSEESARVHGAGVEVGVDGLVVDLR